MLEIGFFDFSLIKHNADYLRFKVRYSLQDAFWDVSGVGWVSPSETKYYLTDLFRNGTLSTCYDLDSAGIMLQDYSMRFECEELDLLVKSQIQLKWKSKPVKPRK